MGRFGSPDAEQAYKRLIALWISNDQRLPSDGDHSVSERILRYWPHWNRHYRKPDGRHTSELEFTVKPGPNSWLLDGPTLLRILTSPPVN